jgi:hypothetical protein
MQPPQGGHFTRPSGGLGMCGEAVHVRIYLAV